MFFYQVFPSLISTYHDMMMRACQEKNLDVIQRLVEFFIEFNPNFINMKEKTTSNTALHVAAYNGFFVNYNNLSFIFL